MSNRKSSVKFIVCLLFALLLSAPGSLVAKTFKLDCTKKGELQKTIDAATDGDTIEITGICMENILIEGKALRLVGAPTPGPHGITGVAEGRDSVRIIDSRGTLLESLMVYNPYFTGVRITRHSDVTMRDCEVSNSMAGQASGIWVQEMSKLNGVRLRLDDNLRGLFASWRSTAVCEECDLNGNTHVASTASESSTVTLINSLVTGLRGLHAETGSYINLDCRPAGSSHPCGLETTGLAGVALGQSHVAFYDTGDFSGWLRAKGLSRIWLSGARQALNTNFNDINDNSALRLEPGPSGANSGLDGMTSVKDFSNVVIYGLGAVLVGDIVCDAGGDAWAEPGIDLSAFPAAGCMHMPSP